MLSRSEKRELSVQLADNDFAAHNRAFLVKNRDSGWIFVIASKTRSQSPRGNVLLIPAYAVNSHEYFLFSYYLLENGFNVLRFDGINNVGLSSGTIERYTLGQLEGDLSIVIDTFLEAENAPLILVTQSLSFPVALKYSTYSERISKIIALVGVVNVKDTVERVMKSSLDPYVEKAPDPPRHQRIFGHLTLAQNFVDDMIKNSYSGLRESTSYFQKSRTPVYMVSSRTDEFVVFDEILKCKEYIESSGKLVVLPDASHMIGRSLTLAKSLARMTVGFAADEDPDGKKLVFPKLTDSISAASIESDFYNQCERQIYAK